MDVDQIDNKNYPIQSHDEKNLLGSGTLIPRELVGTKPEAFEEINTFMDVSGILAPTDTLELVKEDTKIQEAEIDTKTLRNYLVREIIENVEDPRNIIQGKRHRKPKVQFHQEVYKNFENNSIFFVASQLATRSTRP